MRKCENEKAPRALAKLFYIRESERYSPPFSGMYRGWKWGNGKAPRAFAEVGYITEKDNTPPPPTPPPPPTSGRRKTKKAIREFAKLR